MDYFDGLPAYHAAQQALLEGAMRRIDWVDPDLSATTAASSLCADQFARIAKASTLAKIRVLLRNDTYLWRRCQRLTMLLNAYSHVLEIRLVDEVDAPQIPACLLSESGMVRCFHPDTPKGEAGADGRAIAPWRQWFDAAWLRAHPPVEGRRLGI